MTLKTFRCYRDSNGDIQIPENEDTAKYIVFTYHNYVSGNDSYFVGQYWAATQNLDSWPQQQDYDNWYWLQEKKDNDYTETFDMNGHPHHLYNEHGYAYSFSILSKHMVFIQGLRPVYEKKMIRAVRKEKKPTAVKPAWADSPKLRPVYQMGPVIIYNDGTKVFEK